MFKHDSFILQLKIFNKTYLQFSTNLQQKIFFYHPYKNFLNSKNTRQY
jgi:hypothetical protein